MTLYLASTSVIRAKILCAAGVDFHTLSPGADESQLKARMVNSAPGKIAADLAREKASRIPPDNPSALVIGADQVLELDGVHWDKPANEVEARQQLEMLRGKTHRLLSAVCCTRHGDPVWEYVGRASLTMRNFSESFLDHYLRTAGPELLHSVGAYQIEKQGVQLFDVVEGDYFTVLGLPLIPLLQFLRSEGTLAS